MTDNVIEYDSHYFFIFTYVSQHFIVILSQHHSTTLIRIEKTGGFKPCQYNAPQSNIVLKCVGFLLMCFPFVKKYMRHCSCTMFFKDVQIFMVKTKTRGRTAFTTTTVFNPQFSCRKGYKTSFSPIAERGNWSHNQIKLLFLVQTISLVNLESKRHFYTHINWVIRWIYEWINRWRGI